MKKAKILLICTLMLMLACLLLAGCTGTEEITSIDIKDKTVIEMPIGKLNYSAHTLLVTYDSGSVAEVALSEDMISELDRLKLYQPGEHEITVSYGGQACKINVRVKRASFSEIKFPENNVFTYDGTAHTVEIEGDIPANASVSYIGGNSFVNAGTYDVTAVITCDGYETERITTTVTVKRAKYNMEGVKFESKEVVYNGKSHSIEIAGQLPEGVNAPTYYINGNKLSGVTDAGEYKVTAVFTTNDVNYEPVPDMVATLNIIPAEYTLGDVSLVFKNENGAVLGGATKVYDGKTVSFDLKKGTVPSNVSVTYTVKNQDGEVVSKSNTETNIKNAGKYTVKIEFVLFDNKNYKAIEPREFTFEVTKAQYDLSDLLFESKIAEYNGEKQFITVTLPKNLDESKIDVAYEYILGTEVLKENGKNAIGVCGAGEYTVRAVFTVKDSNYEEIEPTEATLIIEKKKISVSQFDFHNSCASQISKGEDVDFAFETNMVEGICLEAALYAVENGTLSPLTEVCVAIPDGDGVAVADFDTSLLESGEYACVITVRVENENYVLSNGQATTEYYFNFQIVD